MSVLKYALEKVYRGKGFELDAKPTPDAAVHGSRVEHGRPHLELQRKGQPNSNVDLESIRRGKPEVISGKPLSSPERRELIKNSKEIVEKSADFWRRGGGKFGRPGSPKGPKLKCPALLLLDLLNFWDDFEAFKQFEQQRYWNRYGA